MYVKGLVPPIGLAVSAFPFLETLPERLQFKILKV
jgi:hypothetical protein